MASSSSSMRVLLAFRRWSAVRHHHQQHGTVLVTATAEAGLPHPHPHQQRALWAGPPGIGRGGNGGGGGSAASAALAPRSHHHHHPHPQSRLAFSSCQAAPLAGSLSPSSPGDERPVEDEQEDEDDDDDDALEATLVWPPPPWPAAASSASPSASHPWPAWVAPDKAVAVQDAAATARSTTSSLALRAPPAPPPSSSSASEAAAAQQQQQPPAARPSPRAPPAARLHVRAYHVGGEVDVAAFCAAEGPWSVRLVARDHAILRPAAAAAALAAGAANRGGGGLVPTSEETELAATVRSAATDEDEDEEDEEEDGGGDDARRGRRRRRRQRQGSGEGEDGGSDRLFVVYRFGSVIFFGADEAQDDLWIRRIQAHTQDPSPEPVSDETTLVVVGGGGGGQQAAGGNGSGSAPPASPSPSSSSSSLLPRGAWFALQPDRVVLRRLDVGNARVISSVLGQSVALEYYHRRVDRALDALAPVLHEIAATGRSRSAASSDGQLLRLIGENSLLYTQVVAKLGLLDTSDAAWGKDRYHGVWRALRGDYELDRRFDALNRKLGPMLENAKFVLEVREDKKSERSELIIIGLIGMEIVLHVAQHFL
jgi:uncharacterized Rmd1/YagE family protein